VADEDPDLGEDIRAVIARYLAVFFNDIADVAPQLAALKLEAKKRGTADKTLN
jgi:hypothetical protein